MSTIEAFVLTRTLAIPPDVPINWATVSVYAVDAVNAAEHFDGLPMDQAVVTGGVLDVFDGALSPLAGDPCIRVYRRMPVDLFLLGEPIEAVEAHQVTAPRGGIRYVEPPEWARREET